MNEQKSIRFSLPDGAVVDLGIFVKSVLHGGAASRDGRLRTNDQLVKHFPTAPRHTHTVQFTYGELQGYVRIN
jgi:hypothetical protein